jgi:hypothetical protein
VLDIMLCGAGDTSQVRDDFTDVVGDFGGNPLHYLSGDVLYVNAATTTWSANSRATAASADLCVFVIVRTLGSITWETEFREVLSSGKPFVVLCLDETYHRYLQLNQDASRPGAALTGEGIGLVSTLSRMEREFQVTVVAYPDGGFREVLRRQLGLLFSIGLGLVETQNRRQLLRTLFDDPRSLSAQQIEWTTELALDELEDKGARKRAINALVELAACTEEATVALLDSPEQGIQRLAFAQLAGLYAARPPEPAFLAEVVSIANRSDDVGVGRRMIPTLFSMDVSAAITALHAVDLDDVGMKRRIGEQLEMNEGEILGRGLRDDALRLAERCAGGNDPQGWRERLKAFIARNAPKVE